jgi:hypothetical protein
MHYKYKKSSFNSPQLQLELYENFKLALAKNLDKYICCISGLNIASLTNQSPLSLPYVSKI